MQKSLALLLSAVCLALAGCMLPSAIVKTGEMPDPNAEARYGNILGEVERMARRAMSRSRIPGLSIALADSRGPIWEAGFGFADDARKVRVGPDTMFSIQSMSKTFTAVGVLTGVRDGLLELDAPVSRYLPGFTIRSIFEDHPENRITLRHLLTHTAGFTHEAPGGGNYDPAEPSFDEHVARIQDTWLMFRVGDRYQYSNLGIDLAGYALEKAAAKPFIGYMKEKVFDALGMTRTTMDPALIRAEVNRATGHQLGVKSVPIIVPMTGAGGVYSSAHDLATFVSFMLRQNRADGDLLPYRLYREMVTTPNNGGYGLGIAMGRRNGDLYFTHGGGGYGFLTSMAWYPTLDIGIVVLTNSANHKSAHVALAEKVIDLLEKRGTVQKSFSLPNLPVCGIDLRGVKDNSWYFDAHPEKTSWKDAWSVYPGRYELSVFGPLTWYARLTLSVGLPRGSYITVRREGSGMTIDGVPLLEQEPGLFFSKTGEALDFRSNPATWRNVSLEKR